MDPILELLFPYVLLYGVLLLGLCGIVYAVTVTIRRAWHPEQRPPPPPARRRDWLGLIVLLTVLLVMVLLGLILPV